MNLEDPIQRHVYGFSGYEAFHSGNSWPAGSFLGRGWPAVRSWAALGRVDQ